MLEREFKRLALTSIDYKRVAKKVQINTIDGLYAAVGAGEISSSQVLNAAHDLVESRPKPLPKIRRVGASSYRDPVQVRGVGNLLTQLAGCCKPLPGDAIGGFITQGRGVSVHREDCSRFMNLQSTSPERIVEVEWGDAPSTDYKVDIAISAYDRQGLLRDISELLANARINVLSITTETNKKSHTATMRLTAEVPNIGFLSKLLERMNRLHNVISAVRVSEGG